MPLTPITDLKPHPANARTGAVDVIADSLRRHGQYRPIVVTTTGTILAGHHVVMAAQSLGWSTIDAHVVDVDEETARGILVADNRLSDIASYDTAALTDLLHSLPDLDGTGFDPDELNSLESGLLESASGGSNGVRPDHPGDDTKIRVGKYVFYVEHDPYEDWETAVLEEAGTIRAARRTIRTRLRIPDAPKPEKASPPNDTGAVVSASDTETVPCAELIPYPGNARQGDIGAISASLMQFGQYRPIVVSRDNTVLVGNHTLAAAQALGWPTVQVVRVHVDDDQARRIVLVDNRSSDIASYDDDALKDLLTSLSSWDGTGYDAEDVDDLLSGGAARPTGARTASAEIGAIRFTVRRPQYEEWEMTLPAGDEETEIAARLGLPTEACIYD